ncbi:MAG: PAS domain S-box protein [Alphaproteobacteria bacterium]
MTQRPPTAVEPARDALQHYVLAQPARLLGLLPVAAYVCDADGTIVQFNGLAAKLWGQAPVAGDPSQRYCGSLRLFNPDGTPLPHHLCPMAEALRAGTSTRDREVTIERPDGSRIIALVNIDPIHDERGRIIGAINCMRDVTDQRRTEARLRQESGRFQNLVHDLPIAVYTTDAAGRLTYNNEAATGLWGRQPELGSDVWCGSWRLLWPDCQPMPHDACPMAIALKEGRPIRGAEAMAERPDGSRVPFLAYPTPFLDEQGAVVGAVNVLVDISEQRRARELDERLASIVESSEDAIVSKDLNGIVNSWNQGAERLFGYRADEMIGRPITTLIPADHIDEEAEIIGRIRRGERVAHYETVRQRKDGSLIEISLAVSPVRDASGRIIGASKIARDITERNRVQRRNQLLLREMNHRIKNLLALAGGVVALSARTAETPAELARTVGDRLGALSRAHDLTLPETLEDIEEANRTTTIEDLLRAVLAPYCDHNATADAQISIDGPPLQVSNSALHSMALLLHEFATNALKHGALSTAQGRVRISWTAEEGQLLLTWQERFGPMLGPDRGTEGFGSTLARGAAQHHLGGSIDYDWDREGLTIRLSLPAARLAS